MCYKYMWDTLVAEKFPSQKFFDFFSLNPNQILSPEIRDSTAKSGFPSEVTLFVPGYGIHYDSISNFDILLH